MYRYKIKFDDEVKGTRLCYTFSINILHQSSILLHLDYNFNNLAQKDNIGALGSCFVLAYTRVQFSADGTQCYTGPCGFIKIIHVLSFVRRPHHIAINSNAIPGIVLYFVLCLSLSVMLIPFVYRNIVCCNADFVSLKCERYVRTCHVSMQ